MLAKWTDRAGQTHSHAIIERYRTAIRLYPKYVMEPASVFGTILTMKTRWEKAHYYLGKHYNKILELEKVKPMGKEAQI